MSETYQNWRRRLAGEDVPISEDRPDPGRYKMRRGKDAPWLPVAIGPDKDGNIKAEVDGKPTDPMQIWVSAAKHPITQDAYKFRMEHGHWPDEPKPAARSNMPTDPYEALVAEIEDKVAQAQAALAQPVDTQVTCDLLRNLQAGLLALNKRADELHRKEKTPHIEKGKAVDDKFRFRERVVDVAARLRAKFETFLKAEERRQREESERKFREERERAAAERARIEAEQAKLEEDDPVAFYTSPKPEMPEMPLAPEPVKVQAGGGFGRRAGLRTVWVPVMTDYKLALAHFAENAKVKELIQKLGEQAVKAGARDLPGFDVKEDRRAA